LIYLEKPNEKPNHYEPFLSITMGGRLYAEGELNLSSSRHYDTDERLYSDFEDMTGIIHENNQQSSQNAGAQNGQVNIPHSAPSSAP
jgi:hypothetical protein